MTPETEDLLEHVLHAVMQPDPDPLRLSAHLRSTRPNAPVLSVIRALLAAERVISETFNGDAPSRPDAALARHMAFNLVERADDHLANRSGHLRLTMGDLPN